MYIDKKTLRFLSITLFVSIIFLSCSEDDISAEITDETDEISNPDPSQNQEKAAAIDLYKTYYSASKSTNTDPKWTGTIDECNAGNVPKEIRDKILMRIHYFRKATGLHNTLIENPKKSAQAMQAALMMHVNSDKSLNHNPGTDWSCYTEDGAKGASLSLLTTAENAEAIDSYIRDDGANNGPVGHRRWLYFPKLNEVGIGNTSSYNAIYVLESSGEILPEGAPEFISCLQKGMFLQNLLTPGGLFPFQTLTLKTQKL